MFKNAFKRAVGSFKIQAVAVSAFLRQVHAVLFPSAGKELGLIPFDGPDIKNPQDILFRLPGAAPDQQFLCSVPVQVQKCPAHIPVSVMAVHIDGRVELLLLQHIPVSGHSLPGQVQDRFIGFGNAYCLGSGRPGQTADHRSQQQSGYFLHHIISFAAAGDFRCFFPDNDRTIRCRFSFPLLPRTVFSLVLRQTDHIIICGIRTSGNISYS